MGAWLVIVDTGKTGFTDAELIRSFTDRPASRVVYLGDKRAAVGAHPLKTGSVVPAGAGLDTFLSVAAAVARGEPAQFQPCLQEKDAREAGAATFNLTDREREIVAHVLRGSENRRIANELGTSIGNVKRLVSSVLSKMDVNSRLGIVASLSRQASVPVAGVLPEPADQA